MGDLLHDAAVWLADQRVQHAGRPVIYRRPSTGSRQAASVELTATVGNSQFQVESSTGVMQSYESRDYIVRAADLVLDGQAVTPAGGDRIVETIAGRDVTYEVLMPGNGPCWRYSDPYGISIRIHTKQIESS